MTNSKQSNTATLANTITTIKKQPTVSEITGCMFQYSLTIKVPADYRSIFEQAYESVRGFRIMQQDNYVLFSIYQLDLIEQHWLKIICDDNIIVCEQ